MVLLKLIIIKLDKARKALYTMVVDLSGEE